MLVNVSFACLFALSCDRASSLVIEALNLKILLTSEKYCPPASLKCEQKSPDKFFGGFWTVNGGIVVFVRCLQAIGVCGVDVQVRSVKGQVSHQLVQRQAQGMTEDAVASPRLRGSD